MEYSREEACMAWLTHAYLPLEVVQALFKEFESAAQFYDEFCSNDPSMFSKVFTEQQIILLHEHADHDKMHDMVATMQMHAIHIVSFLDEDYPQQLFDIASPPPFLFWTGNLHAIGVRNLAVVGSRKASVPATESTREITRKLSDHGVSIISGLAEGIDAAAHAGCLKGRSNTTAVIGCGIDINYPRSNDKLRKSILEHGGLILSEYPPQTNAAGWHFPVRNRILAGLSRAVVMMECQIKSGSMSTVQHALDQGKEVFAWPGMAGSAWSKGAHQLLREGARYFTTASDILEDMKWDEQPCIDLQANDSSNLLSSLTQEQKKLYLMIKKCDSTMDELAMASGLPTSTLAASLMILQISGLIVALPGKTYHAI